MPIPYIDGQTPADIGPGVVTLPPRQQNVGTAAQGVDIGTFLLSGHPNDVLFVGLTNLLAQSDNFRFDAVTNSLTVVTADSTNNKPIEAREVTADQTTSLSLIRATRISTGAISGSFGTGISVELGENGGAAVQGSYFAAEYDGGSGTAEQRGVIGATSGGLPFAHTHFKADGSLSMQKTGGGLNLKEGANARQGVVTLVAGTKTVNTTKVTASSRIILARQATGGTLGNLSVGVITVGTSFVINSDNAADTSVVYYAIVESS